MSNIYFINLKKNNDIARTIRLKYNFKMDIDGTIEPIYFLITSVGFIILSFIHYKKTGITIETIYLSILSIFFIICFIILNFY